jgi:imidazolonepropionase-like amidohydrolase
LASGIHASGRRAITSVSCLALLLLGATHASGALADANALAIVGAVVFDAAGHQPRRETVVIKDGRIDQIGPHPSIPATAAIVDARGEALLPGFFDLHTHWDSTGTPATLPAIAAADVAAGVTTVNDFNAAPESYEPRRHWLKEIVAPHVNLCARISTPGGHGADWGDTATTKWVTTPEDARVAVDSLLAYRPDCLGEVFTDGWRYGFSPDDTSMNEGTLAALVDEAHKHHLAVLTHTVTVQRGREAAIAGVDVIAHSLQDRALDAQTIAIIKKSGAFLAPTLGVYEPEKPGRAIPENTRDEKFIQIQKNWRFALRNLKALYDAGVPIVAGTDAGMPGVPHGKATLHEMELMVQAGLPAPAALTAATANSARAMGLFSDRGSIERGKRADLVLIKGRPWVDIHDVTKIDRVFIDGKLVFGPGAPVTANEPQSMPAADVGPIIDDFQRKDGRTELGTLPTTDPDHGLDRSVQIDQIVDRAGTDRALLSTAVMSVKAEPYATTIFPLTRGAVQPVDVGTYRGLQLDIRGNGAYTLICETLTGAWSAEIPGGTQWQTVRVPFGQLKRMNRTGAKDVAWTGNDLTAVAVRGHTAAGEKLYTEIDNLKFY